ncbi:unnamed protein product, partial [Meganyctiphanes norvegica]
MESLNCKICSNPYATSGLRRPRTINCSHSLCGECASKLLVNRKIICPFCQRTHACENIDGIIINRDLISIIEMLASASMTSSVEGRVANEGAIPKEVPTAVRGPKLHYGICDEHGTPKVHYCRYHSEYICSDCAVGYHMDGRCIRVPIKTHFNDKKSDLCKSLDSQMTSLQEAGDQIDQYQQYYKESINKLETKLKEVQISLSIYSAMKSESENWIRKNITSVDALQNSATIYDLEVAEQNMDISECKTKNWDDKIKESVKQSLGEIITSDTFPSIIKFQHTFATCTHAGRQRWGRIKDQEGYTVIQSFSTVQPPTSAFIINMKDVTTLASSPRHVYFNLSRKNGGTPLGRVVIRLNDTGAPRWAQQMVDLALGHTANRWTGSTFMSDDNSKGSTGEYFRFCYFLAADNQQSFAPLYKNLESGRGVSHQQGLVVMEDTDHAIFRILTRCGHPANHPGPVLGEVVSGLPVLDHIINHRLVGQYSNHSQVIIAQSGLIINS